MDRITDDGLRQYISGTLDEAQTKRVREALDDPGAVELIWQRLIVIVGQTRTSEICDEILRRFCHMDYPRALIQGFWAAMTLREDWQSIMCQRVLNYPKKDGSIPFAGPLPERALDEIAEQYLDILKSNNEQIKSEEDVEKG